MGKSVSVGFRVDAGRKLGLGHLSRCRSLMLAFSRVADCRFSVVTNSRAVAREFLPGLDVRLHAAGRPGRLEHFDIGIVDVPGIAARKIESFQDASGLVVAIDDDGPGLNGQDILVRPNLLGCPRPPQLSEKNYWSGRRYIILHPDFALKSPFKRSRPEPVRRLLVCFGGSDPGRLTMRVIPLLEKLGAGLRVHLVLGAAFPWRQEVAARIARDARFSFSCNVPNMAKAFRTADAALISGGTLLYEACALGVPALVLAQNAAQAREARFFGQAGGVRDLGMGKSVTDADIYAGLERMIGDGSARNKMARKGPGLVAPDGAIRIAARLLARLQRGRG